MALPLWCLAGAVNVRADRCIQMPQRKTDVIRVHCSKPFSLRSLIVSDFR